MGRKKNWRLLLNILRPDFVVNVLRTTQFIRRIRSIDIISLREIPAIARRAFISIENELLPREIPVIVRKAFISIENEISPYAIAHRAFISIENELSPYAIAHRAFISIENEQFLTIMSHFLHSNFEDVLFSARNTSFIITFDYLTTKIQAKFGFTKHIR